MLLVGLFFRPAIASAALAMSFVIASPVVKLINITLLPMLQANHAATGVWSIIIQGLFGLVLYMAVIKAALVMVFMAPQAFPDQVLQVISAGMGDLGQSQALSTAQASEQSARVASDGITALNKAGTERVRARVEKWHKDKEDAAKKAADQLATFEKPNSISGGTTESVQKQN